MKSIMKTISYFDFKYKHFKQHPHSSYRLGQHFINTFLESSEGMEHLWNEEDNTTAECMIFKLIDEYNWDMMSLKVLRDL